MDGFVHEAFVTLSEGGGDGDVWEIDGAVGVPQEVPDGMDPWARDIRQGEGWI